MIYNNIFFFVDYGWVFLLLIMPLNAVLYRLRARKYIKENPDLKEGYNRIFFYFGVLGSIPFMFISYDMYFRGMGIVYNMLSPDFYNQAVLGAWISLIILDVAFIYWIFMKNGADILFRHPLSQGFFNHKIFYRGLALFLPISQFLVVFLYNRVF